MKTQSAIPVDRHGRAVQLGAKVKLVALHGQLLQDLPAEEKSDVLSMIGEVFEIEEIDEYGQPWVRKSWPDEAEGRCHSHSIALESREMELVEQNAL